MARTERNSVTIRGWYHDRAPLKKLSCTAARKSAGPIYETNSEDSGSSTAEASSEDTWFCAKARVGSRKVSGAVKLRRESEESRQRREVLFNDLSRSLCSPSHERYGTFASSEGVKYSREGFILQSFSVEGAGELQIPLSAGDVSILRGVCEKAPYGQCWEVGPSKVTFSGAPEFMSNTIRPLAMHAVRDLRRHGAAGELEVHLDKLWLCETDNHLTFRRDMGKEKGLFATLLLQIPTEDGYKGGSLVVQHENSQKTFDCDVVSSVGFCYTVFCADCKQMLGEIKSGTRICLAFNLVRLDSSVRAFHRELITSKVREAEAALQTWLIDVTNGKWGTYSPKLLIPLSHKFDKDLFSFGALKGHDSIVLDVLKQCRDKNGKQLLDLHLCLVTKHQSGYVNNNQSYGDDSFADDCHLHCVQEAHSKEIEIKFWVGEDGRIHSANLSKGDGVSSHNEEETEDAVSGILAKAFGRLDLDSTEMVVGRGEHPFYAKPEGRKDRTRSWEECYHRVMLVVWPKEISISLFCEIDDSYALHVLEHTVQITDPNFREHLLRIICWCDNNVVDSVAPHLLQLCIKSTELKAVIPHVFQMLAKTRTADGPYTGYQDKKTNVDFPLGIKDRKVVKQIAAVVQVYGWRTYSSSILELVKECAVLQAGYCVRLATELFSIGQEEAGTIVGNSIIEALEERMTELETELDSRWCQPEATFPSHPTIENFLRGPAQTLRCEDFETYEDAMEFVEIFWDNECDASAVAGNCSKEDAKPFVEIRKSSCRFEDGMERWKNIRHELSWWRNQLRRAKSRVERAKALAVSMANNGAGQHGKKRQRQNSTESVVYLSSDTGENYFLDHLCH